MNGTAAMVAALAAPLWERIVGPMMSPPVEVLYSALVKLLRKKTYLSRGVLDPLNRLTTRCTF